MAKVHKDKAELDRMKREVAKSTVEKGVNECTRLKKIYEKKRTDLERQHEEVRQRLEEERANVRVVSNPLNPSPTHSLHVYKTIFFYGLTMNMIYVNF